MATAAASAPAGSSTSSTRSWWNSPLTLAFATAAAGATAVAMWLHLSRKRKRDKMPGSHLPGPSLADEIKEALRLEGEEEDAEADEVGNATQQAEVAELFQKARTWVSTSDAAGNLSTEDRLSLYGCYKQATEGDCPTTKRPWGMEASMKWEAWNSQRGATRQLAMRRYVAQLDEVAAGWRQGGGAASTGSKRGAQDISTGPAVSLMGLMVGSPGDDVADETPVGQLCERIAEGDVASVRQILRASPGLAARCDRDSMTPLHWAADRGVLEVAELLLAGPPAEAQSRTRAQDKNGDTPLHFAVLAENIEVACLLVKHGADPRMANNDGETPEELAEGDELLEALQQNSGGS